MNTAQHIPYCGIPPQPGELLARWNIDPILLIVFAACIYIVVRTIRTAPLSTRTAAYGGLVIAGFAFVSPLCALSVALFSARIVQHMLLTLAAAPLLGLALATRGPRHAPRPTWAAVAFAFLMWFWHAPGPYAATFDSSAIYWAMHLSLLGAAIWLWRDMARTRWSMAALPALALSLGQMGLLAALLVFAGAPLYAPHASTTFAWGLTPLEDQQIGGAAMWLFGSLPFLAAFVFALGTLLHERQIPELGGRP